MTELTRQELQAFMRCDAASFLHRAFRHLHPTERFLSNWQLDVILAKLEQCRKGGCPRLIICQPPRTLKSIVASDVFPAWILGHDSTRRIMCVSYAQELADKHARDCRSIVSSDWYQKLFPTMRLSEHRQAVAEFTTTMNGSRIATSVGGVVTGLGADFIIIDDPLKPDEALSETRRKAANEWIRHTLRSRLNNQETGVIIIVMQRLHEDDVVGNVLRESGERWEVLNFPAVAEQPQTFAWETVIGRLQHHRAVGDVLHPERMSLEQLEVLRRSLGEYYYAAQYQQNPAPLGGGMVKEAWFKRYRPNDLPEKWDRVLQSWDCANKPTQLADYSVCTTWGLKDNRKYLLHVWRKRVDYPSLKRAVEEQYDLYRPNVVLIEDRASGTQLIQELREAGMSAVTGYKSNVDKVMRLDAQTGEIENGLVYLPEEAHWLAEYLHELKTFPKGRYDDQVDSTSQALEWLKKRMPGWGVYELYRMQATEVANTSPPAPDFGFGFPTGLPPRSAALVRLRVLDGTSHVYTITGRCILVPPGRIIEVTEEEAKWLPAQGFMDVQKAE
jgi:predicted phage terminase large subunit-like protein